MTPTISESRSRVVEFKIAILQALPEGLTTHEYLAALSDLLHDANARELSDERRKVHKKAQKRSKK